MLHTKYQSYWPCGFCQEDFEGFIKISFGCHDNQTSSWNLII